MKVKTILSILAVGVALAGLAGTSACRKGAQAEDYEWTTIDESYSPRNYIEEFIKSDSEEKGIFPVDIRNYGQDTAILRRFRGTNFARPNEAALNIAYPGLEDWMLIDIRYKNEKNQEVLRTVLYVQVEETWRVGDSGSLLK